MNTRTKTVLVAAILASSVGSAMAFEGPVTFEEVNYLRNPNAPIPQYASPAYAQSDALQGRMIEYRGVAAPQGYLYPGANSSNRSVLVENFPGSF